MTKFKAVGFDLDGTLFDHRGSAEAGVDRFLRLLDMRPTQSVRKAWFTAEEKQFERWRAGEIGFQEQRRERLRTVLPMLGMNTPSEPSLLDELFELYLRSYRAEWRAFSDSLELLTDLRTLGYRIGLLTNGTGDQQLDKLRSTGLADAFDIICISETIGAQKPDIKAFRALAAGLGVQAGECLFVGDNAAQDVAGAEAAGMTALLVNRYKGHAETMIRAVHTALAHRPSVAQ